MDESHDIATDESRNIAKAKHREIEAINEPGWYRASKRLYLRVTRYDTRKGKRVSRRWVFRWRDASGKLREAGVGSFPATTKTAAKAEAAKLRVEIKDGGDPIKRRDDERRERQAAADTMLTFNQAAERYITDKVEPESSNEKHVAQWRSTLKTYASPRIGHLPVHDIGDHHVLGVLEPLWKKGGKVETATRLRGRIERILDWAAAHKLRSGPNPARWRGHLEHKLSKPSKIQSVHHHPALPYCKMHPFMQEIAGHGGVAARCLEFTVLTAVRTSEAIGARWSEIDWEGKVWTIPGARLKVKKNRDGSERIHRVPLSDAALAVLEAQKGQHKTFVFPGAKGRHLSNMAMLELLKDLETEYTDENGRPITVHGFRSSFRDWAADCTQHQRQVIEFSLAHINGDKAEAAYFRSDVLEKRRALMGQWAQYIATKPKQATVTPLAKAN